MLKGVYLLIPACLSVFLLTGCGGVDHPETFPVEGVVTLEGEPVEGANVVFQPTAGSAGRTARGVTDSSGAYSLTTFNTDDGAVAGDYKVTISKTDPNSEVAQEIDLDNPGEAYTQMMTGAPSDLSAESQLPAVYADPNTTPETRTVASGDNNFNFDLKKGTTPAK